MKIIPSIDGYFLMLYMIQNYGISTLRSCFAFYLLLIYLLLNK